MLHAQQRRAHALREVLGREAQALRDDRVAELAGIVAEKESLLAELEAGEGARRELADAHLPEARGNGDAGTQWQALLDVVAECARINAANGQLISARQDMVARTLHVLRGNVERPAVYAADGRAGNHGGSRFLGRV